MTLKYPRVPLDGARGGHETGSSKLAGQRQICEGSGDSLLSIRGQLVERLGNCGVRPRQAAGHLRILSGCGHAGERDRFACAITAPAVDAYPLWMVEHPLVQRVSTYGIARDGDSVLMVRIANFGGGGIGKWMLPGGGLDHGEHPEHAVVREFAEETGYRVTVDRLLEVASDDRTLDNGTDFHGVYVLYAVTVPSGRPQAEVAGSTDGVGWVEVADVRDLPILEAFRGILYRWL